MYSFFFQSDIMIRTPTETTKFRNLRTPKLFRKTSLFDSMSVWSTLAMYDTRPPATCEIMPERVKTLRNRRLQVNIFYLVLMYLEVILFLLYVSQLYSAFIIPHLSYNVLSNCFVLRPMTKVQVAHEKYS